MKIVYIISDIDKAVYFEETALHLREAGYEPSFVLINCVNSQLEAFLIKNKFRIITIQAGSLFKSYAQIKRVKSFLKEEKCNVVHCHLAQANWIGLWAAKLAGVKKRIYTRHSGEPLNIHWKEKLIDKIQNRLATQIVAISKTIDTLLEKQGVPQKKRILIHHGFHIERFQNPEQNLVENLRKKYNPEKKYPVIGVNARWLELKGIQYIVPAFTKLLKQYPQSKLLLFGGHPSGDYYEKIKALISELPAENLGSIAFENDVYSLYHLFDVYVHVPVNATCEAFGQTYVEALAAGIPSVFTLSGIAHEFIRNNENALVVPYCDANSIYEAIKKILENQELSLHLKEQGQIDVMKKFGFNRYIAELIACYNG